MGKMQRSAPGRVWVELEKAVREQRCGDSEVPAACWSQSGSKEMSQPRPLGQWAECTSEVRALAFTDRDALFKNCLLREPWATAFERLFPGSVDRHQSVYQEQRCLQLSHRLFGGFVRLG